MGSGSKDLIEYIPDRRIVVSDALVCYVARNVSEMMT